ncbi:YueI family protein [Metabacillus indicus]|uniref:YueI family protein n=1 Tax=Metabacillus indicus TaxID=246786 RepID=UPI002A05B2C4|nr:YueI family protein [Metabacillus indicus]MDX8290251.1 YueI family protein [Metabacillus indicus]
MSDEQIDLYLKQGIYGAPETKPEERNKFLGTLRERIEIALTNGQVRQKKVYSEAAAAIRLGKGYQLLLNGTIAYSDLSKYIKLANEAEQPFTIVSDQRDTKIGLIVAAEHAIDKESIFVEDSIYKKSLS